ncbi:MAG: sensor histidine kinase [Bacteroidia bacterium]
MNLLNKTNRYYITATLVVFLIGTLVFYVMINQIMDNEANEQLLIEKVQLTQQLDALGQAPPAGLRAGDQIDVVPIPFKVNGKLPAEFKRDTSLFFKENGEVLPFRQLRFLHTVHPAKGEPQTYLITITKALFEDDDLIMTIVKSMLILFSLLLLVMFEINRRISRKLWKPFYDSIRKLEVFNISHDYPLQFQKSGIKEFDELNSALENITSKISQDYHNLKEFSENASHEIQTPLAIIKSKLELLIQDEKLGGTQMKLISDAYESAGRLSRLNQALILLTRISNGQYLETKEVSWNEIIIQKLEHLHDLLNHKNLQVAMNLSEPITVRMNPVLADILFSNLVGNAIKHNFPGGWLRISSEGGKLMISNSGEPLSTEPTRLFDRFRKDQTTDSLGLGLAIVKQICDSYHISVSYTSEGNAHTLSLQIPVLSHPEKA